MEIMSRPGIVHRVSLAVREETMEIDRARTLEAAEIAAEGHPVRETETETESEASSEVVAVSERCKCSDSLCLS